MQVVKTAEGRSESAVLVYLPLLLAIRVRKEAQRRGMTLKAFMAKCLRRSLHKLEAEQLTEGE